MKDIKNESTSGFGIFVTFIVFVFILGYFIVITFGETPKDYEINKIKKDNILIENDNIQKLINQDTVDYYIDSLGRYIAVKSFPTKKDGATEIINYENPSINGHYTFIDNQWYIYKGSKKNITKEEAINNINRIVDSTNQTLEKQIAVNKSWENK